MKKTWVSAFCFIALMVTAVALASPVPDTGQTKCYDVAGSVITCPSPGQPLYGQDANYTINPMSYTKLDGSGNALPDSATSWAMVKNNVTGLIWEVKTSKDGTINNNDPHDADNNYTWYDPTDSSPGTLGNGTDTKDFIDALNSVHFGGFSDWRMPTINELVDLVNFNIPNPGPTINTNYFPNTQSFRYWSGISVYDDRTKAWTLDFNNGANNWAGYNKSDSNFVRAVRGAQAQPNYVDNGNGTITDRTTDLMWQQDTTSKTWEQALSYCEELSLGGYTDWRLPTIKELQNLVDSNRSNPAINTTFFPNTASSFYWSNTTFASQDGNWNQNSAWVMYFSGGADVYGKKYVSTYVRAVRGGQGGSSAYLVISPTNQAVSKDLGTTTFSVSNTGTGTMPWTAEVTSGGSWLSIASGASGSNSETITCNYSANDTNSTRTATIRTTASGATGSPVDVTVTQAPMPTGCTATIDGGLSLHIPLLSFLIPYWGAPSYWANLGYAYNPAYPALIFFKLTNAGMITGFSFSCTASTLSDDLKIHIPDVLLPDEITHLWVDLEYSPAHSTDGTALFIVTNYGGVSN